MSSLSLSLDYLRREVSDFLAWGRTYLTLSNDQQGRVDSVIESGLRQFYFPMPISGETTAHEWSFLTPQASVTLEAGTNTYDAPVDFGGLVGRMTYAEDTGRVSVVQTSEYIIRNRYQHEGQSGIASLVAVLPKKELATSKQGFQFVFWPKPNAADVLTYRYVVQPNKLTQDTHYPYGGMVHAETILQSCLDVAEARLNDEQGVQHQRFLQRLAASIAHDRRLASPGRMGKRGQVGNEDSPSYRTRLVTYTPR